MTKEELIIFLESCTLLTDPLITLDQPMIQSEQYLIAPAFYKPRTKGKITFEFVYQDHGLVE